MSYAEITFKDKNPIKRWLQRRRLVSAIRLCTRPLHQHNTVCDFGAGNGELCKVLAERYAHARIVCYEPTPRLMLEAKQNLGAIVTVEFCEDIRRFPPETFDAVFCLEVFEHLPQKETVNALQTISEVLKPDGVAIIGVPVETGIPALYKGIFRMSRRYGTFSATARNVLRASVGYPPKDRPFYDIAPGFTYHESHMGFNHHRFVETLASILHLQKSSASPIAALGSWLMPEVYFVAGKAAKQ